MREDNNRRVRAKAFHVPFQPFELLISELPKTAGLKIQTLTSAMKWTPFLLKLYQPDPLPSTCFSTVRGKAFRHR